MNDKCLLELRDIKTYYPVGSTKLFGKKEYVRAVDGVSLKIRKDETFSLVGESGCGKSTIGKTIVRLESPQEGALLFRGEDYTHYGARKMKPLRPKIQMVFQDPYSSLNPRRSVGGMIAEVIKANEKISDKEVREKLAHYLSMVGLSPTVAGRYPHEFSGGQRQRISIVKALVLNPEFVICDEAVSALDVSIQAQILNLLKQLQAELGLTYLFISHGLGPVKYISDRVAVMYLGKIVEMASTVELFENPVHPYTQALFSAYPIPDPTLRDKERIVLRGSPPSPIAPPSGCRFHTRCQYAKPICAEQEPTLSRCGDHFIACHLAGSGGKEEKLSC